MVIERGYVTCLHSCYGVYVVVMGSVWLLRGLQLLRGLCSCYESLCGLYWVCVAVTILCGCYGVYVVVMWVLVFTGLCGYGVYGWKWLLSTLSGCYGVFKWLLKWLLWGAVMVTTYGSMWLLSGCYGVYVVVTGSTSTICGCYRGLRGCYGVYVPLFSRENRLAWLIREGFTRCDRGIMLEC